MKNTKFNKQEIKKTGACLPSDRVPKKERACIFPGFLNAALALGVMAALAWAACVVFHSPPTTDDYEFPETKFGAYLATRHAIWADDFESVMKFSDVLEDSDIMSVKTDVALGRFLAGKIDSSARILAGEKGMLPRSAYSAYLLTQDNWKEIYKLSAKDDSQMLAPLRIWSAVAVGKESEAIKFIDSMKVAEGWRLFAKGMVYAETNRPDKAKDLFDKVPLDFINLNDYLYLEAFYEKHDFDQSASALRADFAATPGGAFAGSYSGKYEDYVGHKKALGFGLVQNVSHTPAMAHSSASLVLLRLAEAAINSDDDAALNYYLGVFFYNAESPACKDYFDKIEKDSPYYPFVMLKNAEKADSFRKMRSELNKALRKNPTFMPALAKLVAINLQKGRENDALKIVNNALKASAGKAGTEGGSDSIRSHLLRMRARIHFHKGDLGRAEDDILKAGDLTPLNPDVLSDTAKIWTAKRENLDQAYLYAAAVIKQSPSDIDGWDTLAMVVWAKEGAEEASEILERVSRVASENSALFQHLGDARAAMGDKRGARDAYERALEHSGDGLSCGEKCLKKKIRRLR